MCYTSTRVLYYFLLSLLFFLYVRMALFFGVKSSSSYSLFFFLSETALVQINLPADARYLTQKQKQKMDEKLGLVMPQCIPLSTACICAFCQCRHLSNPAHCQHVLRNREEQDKEKKQKAPGCFIRVSAKYKGKRLNRQTDRQT